MQSRNTTHLVSVTLLLVVGLFMLNLGWVGYIGSDDSLYAAGARGWLTGFPYLGDTHWALRHPFVIPVALSFHLFGETEFSLALVSMAYYLATLVLAYVFLVRHFPANAALVACLVLATTPVFAIWSTIPGPDIAEVFLVLASLYAFDLALDRPGQALGFFLAGVLAGLAWLTRETALGVVLLYALLFVAGYGGVRRAYLWVGLGFALVAGFEVLWYWAQTGDPLYRLWIDLDQGGSKGARQASKPITTEFVAFRLKHPAVALLGSHEFALLFYFFVPAAIWALFGRLTDPDQRRRVLLLVALATVWFVVAGYVIPLRSLSRYFEVSALAAALVVGIWIVLGLAPRRRWLAGLVMALLIGSNLIGIYVDNRQPLFGERALVDWVGEHRQFIYTDPVTAHRAGFLLRERGLQGLVATGDVPGGGLYFYNPNSLRKGQGMAEGWGEQGRIAQERKWSGYLLEVTGLDRALPASVVKKLNAANDPVVILRRPAVGEP